jgi:methionyl-tRNA formyltransferase
MGSSFHRMCLLRFPRLGCVNIHASLLPRWRGAAPIQRALLAGDTATGISIMQMDEGLDTGPVLLQEAVPIAADDTAQTLHDRLALLGAQLIVRALAAPRRAEPQDNARATYAAKIDKREARIDWNEPAQALDRRIRAFNPTPGAATAHGEMPLKIWRAVPDSAGRAAPGEVARIDRDGITVTCGAGSALKILELQRAGGKRLGSSAFLAGCALKVGDVLGP